MSKTIEISKEAAIEFRRLHDEVAMLRGLIEVHNAKIKGEKECNEGCGRWRERDGLCHECPSRFLIELPEQT